ncbi:MAG: hypothetical protein K2N87_09615 [Eubacterium sp.]|nr:hypothetical protein [Eubacterium sp.]
MKKDLDTLLKQALTPTKEPDSRLNQSILRQVKETETMDIKKVRRIPAAAIAAAIVLGAGSVTAYASWKYLAPDKVTEKFNDSKLTDAFLGKDAISIHEEQTIGKYRVTLIGIVSGKDISQYQQSSNGVVQTDRTYCVTAIEYADGTPMPDTMDDSYADLSFFVSPFIKGYDPAKYNTVTMRGGYSEFVQNGILYRLTECDNVEIFADQGLYLGVMDSTFYNVQAYHYDKATGEISRNEGYDGLNALFHLPIDVSKADPEAAANYLTSLEEPESEPEPEPEHTTLQDEMTDAAIQAWMDQLTPENIDEYASRVESSVQILTPDSDGYVSVEYEVEGRISGSGSILVSEYFKGKKPGMSDLFGCAYSENRLESLVIMTYTLNEDGTVTFAAYIPKEGTETQTDEFRLEQ